MNIGFIGCGKMGQAILEGMLARKFEGKIFVFDKSKDLSKFASEGVTVCNNSVEVVQNSEAILLAVKPQDMLAVLQEIKFAGEHKLFVSIAAGLETSFFEENLQNARVIRVMPNLGITVGELAGGYCLGKSAEEKDKEILNVLFGEMGLLVEVEEELMHAVTTLSGCGPGFFSYLIALFADAAEKNGVQKKDALLLAEKTFLGTAKYLLQEKVSPEEFISRVASKGGVTEAGLDVMQDSDLQKIVGDTFAAAVKRSKKLSE